MKMSTKQLPKNSENNLPDWLTEDSKVDELKFCYYFTAQHPLKCIGGRFYDLDGIVDEKALENEVYQMLRTGISTGLAKRVSNIIESLRLYAYSEPIKPDFEYIHVQNGKLDLQGNLDRKSVV